MNYLNDILTQLTMRLPELEWKVNGLGSSFSVHQLPRGLFGFRLNMTGAACVEEIKMDIQALSTQTNQRAASHLALRINQKINVLVALCQINGRKNKTQTKVTFGLNALSTRQQWITRLESDIEGLTFQQLAMKKALDQQKQSENSAAVLSLHGELGEVTRRLTMATEALNQAIA